MFLGARYAQKSVFANFCRRFAPHKSPSQAPYVQIPYPNRPFGGVNRPKPACEFFVDFTQFFFTFFRGKVPRVAKISGFGSGVFIV